MSLNEKIKRFIIDKDLTSTKFADEIGVPRPSISHILSDRNKPSLEIVQKMYRRYPELGFNWFLEDDEVMTKNATQVSNSQTVTATKRPEYSPRESNERKSPELNVFCPVLPMEASLVLWWYSTMAQFRNLRCEI
jgi:DNA-binding XRE family transcriptional regulator